MGTPTHRPVPAAQPPVGNYHRIAWFCLSLLGLSVLVTVVVQLFTPYWFDEANTVFYVRQPLGTMLQYVRHDFSPPAYYVLLRGWVALFGDSEAATGSLSLVAMTLALVLTYGFGRRLFGTAVAARATVLFGFGQSAIFFASETRMYALLMAVTVAATWLLAEVKKESGGTLMYLWYGLVMLFGVYTHYSFWLVVLAHLVALVIFFVRRVAVGDIRKLVIVYAGLVAAYAPQWPILIERVTHWYLAPEPTWLNLNRVGWGLLWRFPLEIFFPPIPKLPWWFELGGTATIVVLVALTWRWFKQRQPAAPPSVLDRTHVTLLAALVVVPSVIYVLLNVYVVRYLAVCTPFICLLCAYLSVRWFRRASRWVFLGAAVLVSGVNLTFAMMTPLHYQDIAWPRAADFLSHQQAGETVIAGNYEDSILLEYYYHGPIPIVRLVPVSVQAGSDRTIEEIRSIGRVLLNRQTVGLLLPLLTGTNNVWYVQGASGTFRYDPELLISELLNRYCKTGEVRQFPATANWQFDRIELQHFVGCRFPVSIDLLGTHT